MKLKISFWKIQFQIPHCKRSCSWTWLNTIEPIQFKLTTIHIIPPELQEKNWCSSLAQRTSILHILINFEISISLCTIDFMILFNFWGIKNWKHCFNKLKQLSQKSSFWSYPTKNHPFFITVQFSSIGKGCVLFQRNVKRKLDVVLYKFRNFTTNEQKLCTFYRELIRTFYSLTIYEHIIFGSDNFPNVLKDYKPNFSCFLTKTALRQNFKLRECK